MTQIPSFGLLEILILAGCGGLVLLVGAIVVAVLLNKRKQARARLDGSSANENDTGQWVRSSSKEHESRKQQRRVIIWVSVIVVVLAIPLLAVVFGILSVIPVRRVGGPAVGPQEVVVLTAPETLTDTLSLTPAPGRAPETPTLPVQSSTGSARRDFLDPDNVLSWAIVLPSMAGLALLAGGAGVALVLTTWTKTNPRSGGAVQHARGSWPRTRIVLLVLLAWFALSAFLVLDLLYAISLSLRFVALYAAFWVLVGLLLLHDSPLRLKLVALSLLVIALLAVRFVDWNSRKPFLKDFNRIQQGMTSAQVNQIMEGYIIESGGGPPGSDGRYEVDQEGRIWAGQVTFRHTDKGWGDADWGVVAFEQGRVIETEFLPD